MGKVLGTPQGLSKDSPFFLQNLNFWRLAMKNMILALALNRCGPNLYFPKAFGQNTRFPRQKLSDMSPCFCRGN